MEFKKNDKVKIPKTKRVGGVTLDKFLQEMKNYSHDYLIVSDCVYNDNLVYVTRVSGGPLFCFLKEELEPYEEPQAEEHKIIDPEFEEPIGYEIIKAFPGYKETTMIIPDKDGNCKPFTKEDLQNTEFFKPIYKEEFNPGDLVVERSTGKMGIICHIADDYYKTKVHDYLKVRKMHEDAYTWFHKNHANEYRQATGEEAKDFAERCELELFGYIPRITKDFVFIGNVQLNEDDVKTISKIGKFMPKELVNLETVQTLLAKIEFKPENNG